MYTKLNEFANKYQYGISKAAKAVVMQELKHSNPASFNGSNFIQIYLPLLFMIGTWITNPFLSICCSTMQGLELSISRLLSLLKRDTM